MNVVRIQNKDQAKNPEYGTYIDLEDVSAVNVGQGFTHIYLKGGQTLSVNTIAAQQEFLPRWKALTTLDEEIFRRMVEFGTMSGV